MSLKLIATTTCPHCQRVAVILNHLKLPYEIKYIDLANPPDWFIKASPLEKVPILFIGEKVLYESLVILDYINTLSPNSLLPADNLERAINRARAEFSNELIEVAWGLLSAKTEESFKNKLAELQWYYQKLEEWLQQTKFIHSDEISLADMAYAPVLANIAAFQPLLKFNVYEEFPRLKEYSQALLSLPAVQSSKIENYDALLQQKIKSRQPYVLNQ